MELSTLRLWLYTVMKVRAGRLLRILPRPLYDRLFAHVPRKLREVERS